VTVLCVPSLLDSELGGHFPVQLTLGFFFRMTLKSSLMTLKASLMTLKASLMTLKSSLMTLKSSLMTLKSSLMTLKSTYDSQVKRWALAEGGQGSERGVQNGSNQGHNLALTVLSVPSSQEGGKVRNVVYMGMGEPLANYKEVSPSPIRPYPHGGVRPFYQKSTCLTQLTLGPYVVKLSSRNTTNVGPNETFVAHRVNSCP